MEQWKIGCSGFMYEEWRDIFYPRSLARENWFDYYCDHFNAIEINTSYYRFPRPEALRKLYKRAPDGFSFSLKAPRAATQFKKISERQRYLLDFYHVVKDCLGEKLGSVLFHFPADLVYTPSLVEELTQYVDHEVTNVVEFRHASWWNKLAFEAFEAHQIIFSGLSHPRLPGDVVQTGGTLYHRLHGDPFLYHSGYGSDRLESLAEKLVRQSETEKGFHIFQ